MVPSSPLQWRDLSLVQPVALDVSNSSASNLLSSELVAFSVTINELVTQFTDCHRALAPFQTPSATDIDGAIDTKTSKTYNSHV